MSHLLETGLSTVGLVEITSPSMVANYNLALKHLIGRVTSLARFHVDISGYSPEVGHALGDPIYLNRDGRNRQFILLTTAQKQAPLLDLRYTTAWGVLRHFFEAEESRLLALTARGVVAGELENTVLSLQSLARLREPREVTVEAFGLGGEPRDAEALQAVIERFRSEPDGWRDEAMRAELLRLAEPLDAGAGPPRPLPRLTIEQPNFWTSEFGGAYVFGGAKTPATILCDPEAASGTPPKGRVIPLGASGPLAEWLLRSGLIETHLRARGQEAVALLRQKMDFILLGEADRLGLPSEAAGREGLRRLAPDLLSELPEAYHGLAEVLRWAEARGTWPEITAQDPAYFYLLRAARSPDAVLAEMLLAELAPLDLRRVFLFHKPLFHRLYAQWGELKRARVTAVLRREVEIDRSGARRALFGPEAAMDERPRSAVSGGGCLPRPSGPWSDSAGRVR